MRTKQVAAIRAFLCSNYLGPCVSLSLISIVCSKEMMIRYPQQWSTGSCHTHNSIPLLYISFMNHNLIVINHNGCHNFIENDQNDLVSITVDRTASVAYTYILVSITVDRTASVAYTYIVRDNTRYCANLLGKER